MNNLNTSCAKSVIKSKKKLPCCWARHSSCRVWSGEGWRHSARRGGRPCQDSWKPRRRSPTTSSSVRSRWTAGTGWNDWHEYFYGLIVILIFQEFLWLLVTLDSGNMAERLRFLPQKHWGKNKNYQKYKKKYKNTKYKTQNTKFLYLREVRRQRWYCKVTPSEERRSKSLVIRVWLGVKII